MMIDAGIMRVENPTCINERRGCSALGRRLKMVLLTLLVLTSYPVSLPADDLASIGWPRLIDSSEIIAEAQWVEIERLPYEYKPLRIHFRIKEVFKGPDVEEIAVDFLGGGLPYFLSEQPSGTTFLLFLRRDKALTNSIHAGRPAACWDLMYPGFWVQTNQNGIKVVEPQSRTLVVSLPPEIAPRKKPNVEWNGLIGWLRQNVKSKYHPEAPKSMTSVWVALGIANVVLGFFILLLVRRRQRQHLKAAP